MSEGPGTKGTWNISEANFSRVESFQTRKLDRFFFKSFSAITWCNRNASKAEPFTIDAPLCLALGSKDSKKKFECFFKKTVFERERNRKLWPRGFFLIWGMRVSATWISTQSNFLSLQTNFFFCFDLQWHSDVRCCVLVGRSESNYGDFVEATKKLWVKYSCIGSTALSYDGSIWQKKFYFPNVFFSLEKFTFSTRSKHLTPTNRKIPNKIFFSLSFRKNISFLNLHRNWFLMFSIKFSIIVRSESAELTKLSTFYSIN